MSKNFPNPALEAEEASDYRAATDHPGALRSETWMTLQTRHAQRLLTGRRKTADKPWIIGLTRFGALMSQLYVCVRLDDPYADWWLVKVEDALEEAQALIDTLRQQIAARLTAAPGMEVKIAQSLKPIRVPLSFANPYAYRAGRMIVDYDALVRGVLTARHVGYLDRKESHDLITLGGRAIRRALTTVLGYTYQGVNRSDIAENNARAIKAKERLGEVPETIVNRQRRARFAPELPSGTSNLEIEGGLFGTQKMRGLDSGKWRASIESMRGSGKGQD